MAWNNNDGLHVRFGTERAEKAKLSEYTTDGPVRMTELVINWEDLPAVAEADNIISQEVKLPAGAFVEKVEITVTTEFDSSGDAATLCIGIIDAVDGTSNLDTDYFVVDATEGELAVGTTENEAGWVGTGVDQALARTSFVTWEVNGEAYTAGEGVVRIYWSVPVDVSDTLVQS